MTQDKMVWPDMKRYQKERKQLARNWKGEVQRKRTNFRHFIYWHVQTGNEAKEEEEEEEIRNVHILNFRNIQQMVCTFISSFSFASTQDSTRVLTGYLHFPPWGILITNSWPPTSSISEHENVYYQIIITEIPTYATQTILQPMPLYPTDLNYFMQWCPWLPLQHAYGMLRYYC